MAVLDPIQLLTMLQNGNPQEVAQRIIQANFSNDPTMQNLLKMGQNNDIQGLKQFAQQYLSQRGMDFDTEMNKLMQALKGHE